MEMITYYTREVGRHLPEKMRADIEKEIRSIIEDNLEDESRQAGRAPDEDMLVTVLQRLGPPDKVAASYLPPRYLIGPELFPHFVTTLRLVLSIVAVVAVIAVGLSFASSSGAPTNIGEVFGRVIGGMLDALMSAAAVVVLIFAIIQFTSPNLKTETKDWDPRTLKDEPDPETVSIPSALTEVAFTAIAMILFNLYPQWIGPATIIDGEWVNVTALTEAFFNALPWLNVLWALDIALNLWLVAQGRWTRMQRWYQIAVGLLSVLVAAFLLTGPALVGLSAADLARLGWDMTAEMVANLNQGLAIAARITLGIFLATQVIEIGKQLIKLSAGRLPQPITLSK